MIKVFIVQVTDSNGCIDTDTVQIFIFLANISSDTVICQGDSYQVDVFGDNPSSVNWTRFLGVSDPTIENPILSPQETTTYLVDLNNNNGCTITDTLVMKSFHRSHF